MSELKDILQDDQTFTTVILTILLDKYGPDFLYWDPITVGLEIKNDFKFIPDRTLMDKIQAGSVLMLNDLFFKSLETYNSICNVLNIGVFTSDTLMPATLDDCMWGCTEAKLILGEEYTGEFSHDIAGYIGQLLLMEGIYTPPGIIAFAEYPPDSTLTEDSLLFEDEVMYKIFWDRQAEAKQEAETVLKSRLAELMKQLHGLPIEINKDITAKFIGKLEA